MTNRVPSDVEIEKLARSMSQMDMIPNLPVMDELNQKLELHETEMMLSLDTNSSNTNNIRDRLAHLLPTGLDGHSDDYCQQYFNDQDFIYKRLQLPQEILSEIAHSPTELIEYLKQMGQTVSSSFGIDNGIIFSKMCEHYAVVLDYYTGMEYYGNIPDAEFWPVDFINQVWYFCVAIYDHYILDPHNRIYTSQLEKELTHGISIITTQIDLIRSHYRVLNLATATATSLCIDGELMTPVGNNTLMEDMTPEHMDRFIRLANNLCVIMIFIKLYYSDGYRPSRISFS